MRASFHQNYGVPGTEQPPPGSSGRNYPSTTGRTMPSAKSGGGQFRSGAPKGKTDLLPAPSGATDKTHPDFYTSYKGVIVHRRPLFIETMADRDTWLRWLTNMVDEVKRNRKKDSDEITRLRDKNTSLDKGWTTEAEKNKIKKNKGTITSLQAKLKQHDVRKEWYTNTTPYVRDLFDKISKAATPEDKQAAAADARTTQSNKDTGVSAEASAEPVTPEETVVAETVVAEEGTAVSTDAAAPVEEEPSFFAKYRLILLAVGGLAAAGGAYYYFKSNSE